MNVQLTCNPMHTPCRNKTTNPQKKYKFKITLPTGRLGIVLEQGPTGQYHIDEFIHPYEALVSLLSEGDILYQIHGIKVQGLETEVVTDIFKLSIPRETVWLKSNNQN